MIKTGNNLLDDLIEGYGNELTMIYGAAGTGKTTIAMLAAIQQARENRKVIFIDTENQFSIDRFKQLSKSLDLLKNIFLIKVNSFYEQEKKIESLRKIKNVNLIIIDTISNYYRLELERDAFNANNSMDKQLQILNLISLYVPIIIINQIYSFNEKEKIVGGNMLMRWSKKLIKLEKNPRKIILEKPLNKVDLFEIKEDGISKK